MISFFQNNVYIIASLYHLVLEEVETVGRAQQIEVANTCIIMAFTNLLKKASNLLGLNSDDGRPPPMDGEIIYCKNNVCVHPPASLRTESRHHPGYLNIRSQDDEVNILANMSVH